MIYKLLHHNIRKLTPVSLTLDIDSRCNLNCDFCFVKHRDFGIMPMNTVQSALAMFPHVKSVELGMGEPTLHPKFDEIVNIIYSKGMKIGMGTNGSRLYPSKTWEKFKWLSIGITHFIDNAERKSFKWLPCKHSFILVLHSATPKNWKDRMDDFLSVNPGVNYTIRLDMDADGETRKRFKEEYTASLYYQDRIQPYTGMCYMHCLKPMVYHDGNIYPCCTGVYGDYYRRYCVGNVNGHFTTMPITVDCPRCTKAEELKTIHQFLTDTDGEFL